MNNQATLARRVATAVGTVYAVALFLSGVSIEPQLKHLLAYLPTLTVFALVAFDKWMWRWPGIRQIAGRPCIGGCWLASLQPRDGSAIPEGGNWGPIDAVVIIEQTFWSLSIRLMTDQSSSVSTAAAIIRNGDSQQHRRIVYAYVNTPKQAHQPRSWPHFGAGEIEVAGLTPTRLTGSYWTGRLTVGDMTLRRFTRRTDFGSLQDAQRAEAKSAEA